MTDVAQRTVLVVGASSGIGRAIALALAEDGLNVVVFARRPERLALVRAEIEDNGGQALAVSGDATQPEDLERAVADSLAAFGRLNVVVNCAGTNAPNRALRDIDTDTWNRLIDVNLTASFHVTRTVAAAFRAQRSGLIVHIASTAARFPDGSGVAYQAAKAGVAALAFATQIEEGPNGVRVSVIYPGLTDTDLVAQRPTPPDPDELRWALQPEDVAAVCRHIVSLPAHVHLSEAVVRPFRVAATAEEGR